MKCGLNYFICVIYFCLFPRWLSYSWPQWTAILDGRSWQRCWLFWQLRRWAEGRLVVQDVYVVESVWLVLLTTVTWMASIPSHLLQECIAVALCGVVDDTKSHWYSSEMKMRRFLLKNAFQYQRIILQIMPLFFISYYGQTVHSDSVKY